MSTHARGWLVQVHDPTSKTTKRVAVATAEPIDASTARQVAEARFRKDNNLASSHTLFVTGMTPASIGTTIDSPKCQTMFQVFGFTVGCTNTARQDGLCGKCHHAHKHAQVPA